ncbi:hypothetical protein Tco_0495833 [Tanacetum coccineum]
MEDDVDINALTMEQYIALIPDNIKPGIALMMDTYEHVRRVLEILDLFHFPGVTHAAIMLRYDETTTRERINDVLENVDAIHESFKGEHPTKEYPLKKEGEAIKHSRYIESLEETIIKFYEDSIKKQTADDEKMKKIIENTELNIRALKTTTKNLQEKAYQLTHKVLINTGEKVKAITIMGKENMKDPVPRDLPPMPFLGHLKEQIDEGDMDVGWDITSKNVEKLTQFLTPTIHTLPNFEPVVQPYIPLGPVHDKDKIIGEEEQDYSIPLNDSVMQPLTPQAVHIIPPDDDHVAQAINPMSNKQLNKFKEEFFNITKVAKKEYDNPIMKTYDCETFIRKLLHQVSQSSREMKSH